MKRFWSVLMTLAIVIAVLAVGQPPNQVEASPVWPKKLEQTLGLNIDVHAGGQMTVSGCGLGFPNAEQAIYLSSDQTRRNGYPSASTLQQTCDRDSIGDSSKDGTFYVSTTTSSYGSTFSARRHDRELWSIDTSSTVNCSNWGARHYSTTTVAEAPNDLVVATLSSPDLDSCYAKLIIVNRATGRLISSQLIVPVNTNVVSSTRAWAYSDHIKVIDRSGTVRVYDYSGVEDTSKRYALPMPTGQRVSAIAADANGTVYATSSDPAAQPRLVSVSSTGVPDTIIHGGVDGANRLVFRANGGVAFWRMSDKVYRTTPGSSTVQEIQVTNSNNDHYVWVRGYTEDESGNGLITVQYMNSTATERGVKVFYVAADSATPTEIYSIRGNRNDGASAMNPNLQSYTIDGSVRDGFLYLSFCDDDGASSCYGGYSPQPMDTWIYRISVPSFGNALQTTHELHSAKSQMLKYVALGDSYSSGEGVEPFLAGTATTANQCHRSADAYPILLEEDPSLNLFLQSFVACSGATTHNLLYGGAGSGAWGESAQVNSIDSSTDIVTLTIGGNNMKFTEFATACVIAHCGTTSAEYQESWDILTNTSNPDYIVPKLNSALTGIANKLGAGNTTARVLVLGYPYVVTYDEWNNPYSLGCAYMSSNSAMGAEQIVDKLDDVMSTVVTNFGDSRFEFIDPREANSPFLGHGVCVDDNYFNDVDLGNNIYTYHPNQTGHEAFAEMISAALN